MGVLRCTRCKRGFLDCLDDERAIADLAYNDVIAEKSKAQAKLERLREHAAELAERTTTCFPSGVACPGCGRGWREFAQRRKDLCQLTAEETQAAIQDARTHLTRLIAQETTLVRIKSGPVVSEV